MMKALVAGASGFIGQHLVRCLVKQGFNVNALVRNMENFSITNNVNIFEGDIFDTDVLGKAVDDVDVVFHLVAKTHD
ncbi:MAG: NAD(P)H-binding protein, partial [Candidatus Kuenenia sp.]|nr:NAD(P)H-binding protein [Candidatus Kuenenia sp.]